MDTIQLFLNDRLVSITASASLIQQLRTDDTFLTQYIIKAVKSKQFSFLDATNLNKLTVKRALVTKIAEENAEEQLEENETKREFPLKQVWYRKGKPTAEDSNATGLLLELRSSPKYQIRFNDKKAIRYKIWEDIAAEIQEAGYDVNAAKCQQKFLNLTKSHWKYIKHTMSGNTDAKAPEYFQQMNELLQDKVNDILSDYAMKNEACVGLNEDSDEVEAETDGGHIINTEECEMTIAPPVKKVKLSEEIATISESCLTDQQFNRLCSLMEERTKIMKERNVQNEQLIHLFRALVDKLS